MPRSVIAKQLSKPLDRIIRFLRFSWPRDHISHMPPDRARPSGQPYRAFRARSVFYLSTTTHEGATQ